jgi:CubicO group peptidase (beta-lactamase class C family)
MAMQSGMENSVEIDALAQSGMTQLEIALQCKVNAPPFARYHYNNAAYRLLFTALERASGMDLETLTEKEIFDPLAFGNAHWMRIYAVNEGDERFTGYQSVRMTPRDFAKSTQVIIDRGLWDGKPFISAVAANAIINAPAPLVNPSFGLFHHLNGGTFYRDITLPSRRSPAC